MKAESINCSICELRCRIAEGHTGACGLYEVKENRIVERFADHYLVACPISIETMPIPHFYPGAKFLQISTTGSNFNCPGCISTVLVQEMFPDSSALQHLTAEQIIAKACEAQCVGIVFLMNDPMAAFPRYLKIAQMAHAAGLKMGCSSNGYFTPEALNQLLPYFANHPPAGHAFSSFLECRLATGTVHSGSGTLLSVPATNPGACLPLQYTWNKSLADLLPPMRLPCPPPRILRSHGGKGLQSQWSRAACGSMPAM